MTTTPAASYAAPAEVTPDSFAGPGAIVVEGSDYLVLCGDNTRLRLESLQMEGRKRLAAGDFANGAHFRPGERFD
jgi:methionyl-tRNA formyltransferase